MRRLFWFSIGAALSCALLVWLLWDYSAVLFGVTLLLGAASVRLSGKYRWVRYPAAVLMGMVLGCGVLLFLQILRFFRRESTRRRTFHGRMS